MLIGVAFAFAAGLMWGLTFLVPLLLADYAPAYLAFARYAAFGGFSAALALSGFADMRALRRADWLEALRLGTVGNVVYYVLLASAIRLAGAPLPTVIIGTLPVVIALCAALAEGGDGRQRALARLAPSLAAIAAGVALVNRDEFARIGAGGAADYALGAALSFAAVVCWTWYPLRNARWLRANAHLSARAWASAQGIAILPVALAGCAAFVATAPAGDPAFPLPLGPQPALFVALSVGTGVLSSWVATLCWNAAGRRLSTAFAGQLIVFETLAALLYAYLWRGEWPEPWTLAGVVLLVAGIAWATRAEAGTAA
jgi:drug/metabolite transporter (DMT)-like permease